MTELKVTAHLMRLDQGLFCIVQTPAARHEEDAAGLPGVRLSLPPNATGGVSIASFRPDGWLSGAADAAIVRVTDPAAHLLVTIYQNIASTDPAPRLQVLRLGEDAAQASGPRAAVQPMPPRTLPEIVAHQQVKGDIGSVLGEWIGDRGSKRWIEGFMILPRTLGLGAADIEYQAVLGRGWLSPWSEGGSLCGSRGMALPILGFRVRLKGAAAGTHDIRYEATFVDGTTAEAKAGGEACEAASLSPLEAFRVIVSERKPQQKPAALPRAAAATRPTPATKVAKAPTGRRSR
jgi:hypothetical protein